MQAALNSTSLKRVASLVGAVLCLVAVALLVRRGISLGDALGDRLARIAPAALAASFVLYAMGSVLLGVAWVLLVRIAAVGRPRARALFIAHLRSQLAKYLPGNIFHLAYRHIAARREDVGHRALAAALALESILVITAAAILSLGIASDPRLGTLAPWARDLVWAAPLLALAAWAAISLGGPRFGLAERSMRSTAPRIASVLALDLVFFILAGCALRLLCDQPGILPLGAWWGWLALAWIVGYVTPGAPGGLGLRETVLVAGLGPVLGDVDALAIALAYRLITVVADAAVAGIGFLLRSGPLSPVGTGS